VSVDFFSPQIVIFLVLGILSGFVRGAQTAFAEKHWLFTWAHKLTKNRRSLASRSLFCSCCPLLRAILSWGHLGIVEGQEWSITSLWQGTETPISNSGDLQDRHPSKWGQWPIIVRLHPGAGAVISWEPDGSPQWMIVMPSSLESLWDPLDRDSNQLDHTCDWDCLTMHTFVPCPQLVAYLKL
jgi:hypothetical protein